MTNNSNLFKANGKFECRNKFVKSLLIIIIMHANILVNEIK